MLALLASTIAAGAAHADPLVINNVVAPITVGSGNGERGMWEDAGTVGGVTVDLVATINGASLDHNITTSGSRPSITSSGQDDIWIEWRIFQNNTYDINTNSGGVPVAADVHVQLNDIDGPNNERAYLPVCGGAIQWVRIDQDATTGKAFGTVDGRAETFSLIGDADYNSEPHSGVEVFYPNTSTFTFGRTANTPYFIRLDNPTYSAFDTFDFECADFTAPVANDDTGEGTLGDPLVIDILANDTIATANDNPPHNNSQAASEYGRQSVSLIAPGAATGVTTTGGDVVSFSMPGEGAWSFSDTTGLLTFTPIAGFAGTPTAISYTFDNALGVQSNAAAVAINYPSIGAVKSATFNDDIVTDGGAQLGETIGYTYAVTAIGSTPIENVSISETAFTGNGATPVPAYVSGDLDLDGRLDPGEAWLFTASYTIVAADIVAGSVGNQATASGETGLGTPVSDLSDSSNPGDGNGVGTPGGGANNDDPTTTSLPAAPIVANDDAPASVPGAAGSGNAGDAFANDTLSGVAVDPADVTATVTLPAAHAGVTLDTATGTIAVAAATPSATYTIGYEICETLNPTNCDDATITITVDPAIVVAADDMPPAVNGMAGDPNVTDAFANDTVDGAALNLGDITVTVIAPAADPGVTLDTSTGIVSVAPGTPAATYTITYRICEDLNPANCDTAVITIAVDPAAIDATDDAIGPVNGMAGAVAAGNAFANDFLNGVAAAPADITASVMAPASHPGVTLNVATGDVDIAAATPAATYTIDYQICENLNPANCDTATITVDVEEALIDAVDDVVAGVVDTAHALAAVVNVLNDDTLNGVAATIAEVTVSADGALPAGFTLQMHGAVDIAQGTPSGVYVFGYRICEILNPANCDAATVTVTVEKSVPVVSGTVYFDANGNGAFNPGTDARLPGYLVELLQGGVLVKATTSDAQGEYVMRDFAPGAGYEVVFRDPATGKAVGSIKNLTFLVDSVMSDQNQAIDPSGVVYNSLTGAPIAGVVLELTTAGGTTLPAACLLAGQQPQTTGADGRYRFDVVPGAAAQCPVVETEYRLALRRFPAGMTASVSALNPPRAGALDATTCPDDAVPGGACQLSASVDAPSPDAPTPYYLAFLLAPGDPNVVNNHIPVDPLPSIPATGLTVAKRAAIFSARRDEIVPYVIEAANANVRPAGPLDIRDQLPPGFAYVRGSARVEGLIIEPTISGRTVTFENLTLPANGAIEIRLSARIGADVRPGEHDNRAWMLDPADGRAVSNVAVATVRVEAEHVFDCGEVIGKVFDDRDRDGFQGEGEVGVPGVRIATVRGTLITTDRYGRYSVPCAELPDADTGSNFILKVDPRTLPDGWALTTENPLVARLTAGKLTKMNFGATAHATVRVELTGRAFAEGDAQPGGELRAGIARLAGVAAEDGTILRVIYRTRGEPVALVERRLAVTRSLIEQAWRGRKGALPVETIVVNVE
ncbi:MAG: hypothetical protein AB7I79_08735 [Rhizobiaceae bacterium]